MKTITIPVRFGYPTLEITVNGKIDDDEIADFVGIQEDLERISVTVETLQLWCERMLANGVIDEAKYKEYKNRNK